MHLLGLRREPPQILSSSCRGSVAAPLPTQTRQRSSLHIWQAKQFLQGCLTGKVWDFSGSHTFAVTPGSLINGMGGFLKLPNVFWQGLACPKGLRRSEAPGGYPNLFTALGLSMPAGGESPWRGRRVSRCPRPATVLWTSTFSGPERAAIGGLFGVVFLCA